MADKIFLIDDDVEALDLVGRLLKQQGYEVVTTPSAREALDVIVQALPDLILLDIGLPDMDGIELCRRVRDIPTLSSVPVIMFTASESVEDKVAAFQAGADDFVTKPVHPVELLSRVGAKLLRAQRQREQLEPRARGKIVAFLGSRGGIGTTTVAANVAGVLASMGEDVALLELRPGMGTLAVDLGLDTRRGIKPLMSRAAAELTEALVAEELQECKAGFRVLAAQPEPVGVAEHVSLEHVEAVVRHLPARWVIADLGTGLGEVNRALLSQCYHAFVAVEPNRVSLAVAKPLLDSLVALVDIPRARVSLVIVNRSGVGAMLDKNSLSAQLQHEVAGVVSPAPDVVAACLAQKALLVTAYAQTVVGQQLVGLGQYVHKV